MLGNKPPQYTTHTLDFSVASMYEDMLNPGHPMQRQKSMPLGLDYGKSPASARGGGGGGGAFDGLFQNQSNVAAKQAGAKAGHSAAVNAKLQQRRLENDIDEDYDPFGKGGGGAPLRDRRGNVLTDRRKMQKAAIGGLTDTNLTHDFVVRGKSPTPGGMGGMGQAPPGMTDKQRHQWELNQQLEQHKRYKDQERQREKELEAKDDQRIARDLEKMRREAEEEAAKQKAKAEARQQAFRAPPAAGGLNLTDRKTGGRQPPEDGLEWWERQGRGGGRRAGAGGGAFGASTLGSQSLNAGAGGGGGGIYDRSLLPGTAHSLSRSSGLGGGGSGLGLSGSGSGLGLSGNSPRLVGSGGLPSSGVGAGAFLGLSDSGSGQLRSHSSLSHAPPSRQSRSRHGVSTLEKARLDSAPSRPRSAAVRNEESMRNMSAMRERLQKEQIRVKSALRRKDYGEETFSDTEDGVAPGAGLSFGLDDDDRKRSRSSAAKSSKGRSSPFFSDDDRSPPRRSTRSRSTRSSRRPRDSSPSFPQSTTLLSEKTAEDEDLAALISRSRTKLGEGEQRRKPRRKPTAKEEKMDGFWSDED